MKRKTIIKVNKAIELKKEEKQKKKRKHKKK